MVGPGTAPVRLVTVGTRAAARTVSVPLTLVWPVLSMLAMLRAMSRALIHV
jgi:hypothetical protein